MYHMKLVRTIIGVQKMGYYVSTYFRYFLSIFPNLSLPHPVGRGITALRGIAFFGGLDEDVNKSVEAAAAFTGLWSCNRPQEEMRRFHLFLGTILAAHPLPAPAHTDLGSWAINNNSSFP